MTSRLRAALRAAVALLALSLGRPAWGQGAMPDGPPAPAANALTPPKLSASVEAVYPAAARAARLQATVDLDMTIDAAGKVTEVRAVTPVGGGFDEAAVEAARRFVFEPARRGGHAIPARIRYRYAFELPAEPASSIATGQLEGRVLARGRDQVIAGAVVTLLSAEGRVATSAVTDASGTFRFQGLAPDRYPVKIAAPDHATLTAEEDLAAGELTSVTYRMAGAAPASKGSATLEFGATATIEAPPREVTKRSLAGEELVRMAGTRGDPLRAIEYMPGVGRSAQADIIIRGSSPADSEVELEGAPVYRLYHFGGLTSFVQPRLLDKIDLYPGNFSARFGRKMGGIVDVGLRDPRSDGLHGLVDVNVVDSSFLVEGPITGTWSFAVAAKRSYFDLFIDKLVPKDTAQLTAAPVYWDYQAMLAYKPSDADRFRAMVYGSYDDLALILAHPADGDPALRGGLGQKTAFHRAQLTWQHRYSHAIEHQIDVSTGPFVFDVKVGPDVKLEVPGYEGFLRSEWRARLASVRLIGGLDVAYNWFDFSFKGPPSREVDGDPNASGPLTGRPTVELHDQFGLFRPAAYLEAVWQPGTRLTLVPGVRVDYLGDVKAWTVDPRLTARLQLTPTTTLKGGAGLFSQAPSGSESLPVLGNPHLRPAHAQHYSFGVEQEVGARLKLTAEAFYKRLDHVIVNSAVPGENLNNDGIGRIYGGEASAKLRPTAKSSGFLSYTLSRSERRDREGEPWRLFNWDQTHILTVAGAYRVGGSWDLSATFRYVTGNPLTPVVGSVYDARTDLYTPVYGGTNSARSTAFNRLDLRVEKSWQVRSGSIAAYLDLQNALNRKNEEGRTYNFDYSQAGVVSGLPLIPSLGIRGEL